MSIFWVIMPLCLACMTHPMGSACSFNAAYRHRIRIWPLVCLVDTWWLLYEIFHYYKNIEDGNSAIRRIHSAIREVVEVRLRRRQMREHNNDSNPQSSQLIAIFLDGFERYVSHTGLRYLFLAVLILQYVKLCGFYGIPVSFTLATGYFASWIIMEMIQLVGEAHAVMGHSRATFPTPDSSSPPIIPKIAGFLVFIFHTIIP